MRYDEPTALMPAVQSRRSGSVAVPFGSYARSRCVADRAVQALAESFSGNGGVGSSAMTAVATG